MICAHSGIEVTQNNNLFLAGNVPDDGCKVLVEYVFCVWCGPVVELRQRVRRRSEPPLPGSTILSKPFLTANPTPCSLGSLGRYPCQKNV